MKKWVGVLSLALLITVSTAMAGTVTSVASGNWNSPSTWTSGILPGANDDVVIAQGTTVILNLNTPAVRSITIQTGGILRGDGTGKILLVGKGGGEDFTNNGLFDASGPHAATIQLYRPMQWGGTGTYNCSFIDLNGKSLAFTAGTAVTVNVSGAPDPFLNPGVVNAGNAVTVNFNGSAAQNLTAAPNVGFNSIAISNPAGVTLQKNLNAANFTGNLTINGGATLNISNGAAVFGITGATGSTFTMAANALLDVGSTTTAAGSFPSGFSTYALDEMSTVQYNNVSSTTQTVSLTPVYGNLLLSGTGTISLGAGTAALTGNWINNSSGNIQFSGSSLVAMSNGTAVHTIGGSSATSFRDLTVNSTPGISLTQPTTVNGGLVLTNGVIATGTNSLTVTSTASVSRGSGYINGHLTRYVAAGSTSLTFDIGDASTYTPVSLSFTGVSTPGTLTAQMVAGDHPQLASSFIDGSHSVNRYWRLTGSGVAFSSASATFSFAAGDVDAGADPASFAGEVYNGSAWTMLTAGTRTSTSMQVSDITSFGDFAAGNLIAKTITATAGANGTISPNGAVAVTYGSDQSFTVTPNRGYHIADVIVDGMSQGAVSTHHFTNVTTDHSINVSFAINTYTITASSDSNGTISPSGVQTFNFGDSQTYTFTPNTGYHVANVLVDSVPVGSPASYTFDSISANHTISVSFAIDQFTISASAGANGTIAPAGAVVVSYGANQPFTFTPSAGYHIDSVLVDGVKVDSVGGYTFVNVTANHTVHVSFAINRFTITASAGANGSVSPSGPVLVDSGSSQAFTFTPAAGYHVDSVIVDGVLQPPSAGYTFTDVVANHTISVAFAIDQFTITASAGTNGSISPSGTVTLDYNASQIFTFTPAANHHVDSLIVDGVPQPAAPNYTFNNVTANHTIHVTFAIDQFAITPSAGANGSISPSATVDVVYGGSQAFTFTPATGYHVDSVIVDGTNQSPAPGYTFTDVTAPHTIRVTFAIDQFTITASSGPNGSIAPSGAVAVEYGGSQTFNFTASPTYHVDSVIVDGVSQEPLSSYTFTNVTADHSIRVTFAIDQFTILATSGPNGSISPSGPVGINFDGTQQFTFTPVTGYHVDSLVVDGVIEPSAPSYTFTNVTANHTIHVTFAIDHFIITASAGANGTISPSGSVDVTYGAGQTFTFTPSANHHVDSVLVDGVVQARDTTYTFPDVTASHTIRVTFAIDQFVITASAGTHGSISPSGSVEVAYGANQTFTFTPDTGYYVSSLHVDSVSVAPAAQYTFTNVTGNHTIDVGFALETFTLHATAGLHGKISPAGNVTVNFGASQTFVFTPDTGYYVAALHVDTLSVAAAPQYTFTNVRANHTIDVAFALQYFLITASAGPHGAISPSGAVALSYGGSETFTMTPDSGWAIADVVVDSVSVGPVASYRFQNVVRAHTISASFTGLNYPPAPALLVMPLNRDTINVDSIPSPFRFGWHRSVDPDSGDTVRYTFHAFGGGLDTVIAGLTDTALSVELASRLHGGSTYLWTVSATDGHTTVASPDTFSFTIRIPLGIKGRLDRMPKVFALYQNYPNPFNPTTNIEYDIPHPAVVTIKVYNILGAEVATLVDHRTLERGAYVALFDGSNLASGIYFYRIEAKATNGEGFVSVKKLMLLK